MTGGSWKRIGTAIGQFLFGHSKKRTKRSAKSRDTALRGEWLEPRQLLSANQITYDPATREILIEGTAGGDNTEVWIDTSNNVQVVLANASGGAARTFSRSFVGQIRFLGGDSDDRFNNATDILSYALGEGGNDDLNGGSGLNYLVGGSGNDRITGGASVDYLDGQDGNDQLFGRGGDDVLMGGTGDDGLYGDDGNDQLFGQDGTDYFEGGTGDDSLSGGAGDDYMLGGTGNDGLYGYEGVDQLFGEAGADYLDGGADNDSLSGGVGDDYIKGGTGDDGLYGHDGNDQLFGDDGADYLDGEAGDDTLSGGAGNDYLLGGVGNDGLYGHEGSDRLYAGDGTDYLDGGDDNDFLWGGTANDYIIGGTGDDRLYGEDGNDQLFGQDGVDYLEGGAGNDTLSGGVGDDYMVGGTGDDGLFGHDGADQLFGEDGSDYVDGGSGDDTLSGGAGDDWMLGGAGIDGVYGHDGNDRLFGGDGADYVDGGAGIDRLYGNAGDDYLTGGSDTDWLYGQDGIDKVYGDDGNDYLDGGTGNDLLWGGLGDDYLAGGVGDDTLTGEDGNDTLLGHDGADYLSGGAGDDWMWGGAGDDYHLGGIGSDRIYGGDGNDQLHGENGDDTLDGGTGNDYLAGAAGNDGLLGGDGNDQLFGNEGNDYLVGGYGDDSVDGGNDNDMLIGGMGVDQLNGQGNDDILIGGTTIYDDDTTKLCALMTVWGAALPYASRIQAIEDELFATHLESNETVFDDQVADYLYGNGGDDWFFMTGYLGTYSPPGSEMHDHEGDEGHHKQVIVNTIPALEGFQFIDSLDKLIDRQSTESVHSLVPHADTPTLQREHLALFQLVRYDAVTNIAMRSGAWSDPSIWQNGQVPTNGAKVLIPIGVDVQVDRDIAARLSTIRVDGDLSFITTQNSVLRVDTIVVTDSGTFEMGTEAAPIANGVTARLLFTDNGAIDRTWDPFGISRGLISHGSVSIFGATTSAYGVLAGPAVAGSTVLTLRQAPFNWKVGDTIVIAATTEGTTQNETRTIIGVSGTKLFLDRPLTYSHTSPAANLDVHVANVTKNAVIESESSVIERRGHVMFMHNRDVHIGYAGFYKLGRTNKLVPINDSVVGSDWKLQAGTGTNPRGRYAVHFHRNGLTDDGNPSTVIGSAVVDSPGWGFVNHSSNVDMVANVAFDVHGAAFATEVGDEIGSFGGNIALGTSGSSDLINARESLQDFGFQGDGYWFQGAGTTVVDNISAGNQGHAFVYYNRGLYEGGVQGQFLAKNLSDPSLAQGADKISVGLVPIALFSNNSGYASAEGLLIRYHLQNVTHGGRSYVSDSRFWNNTVGVDLHYAESVTLQRVSVIHDSSSQPMFGLMTDINEGNIDYENLTVGGYLNGIMLPRWGTNTLTGGTFFNNTVDILIPTAMVHNRVVNLTGNLQTAKISAWQNLISYQYSNVTNFFVDDRVVLNFGSYVNMRLYGLIQKADAVPFPVARPDTPAAYIGLTTQQLWNTYGVAIGNAIAPATAFNVPLITGLIAPNI